MTGELLQQLILSCEPLSCLFGRALISLTRLLGHSSSATQWC